MRYSVKGRASFLQAVYLSEIEKSHQISPIFESNFAIVIVLVPIFRITMQPGPGRAWPLKSLTWEGWSGIIILDLWSKHILEAGWTLLSLTMYSNVAGIRDLPYVIQSFSVTVLGAVQAKGRWYVYPQGGENGSCGYLFWELNEQKNYCYPDE